MIEIVLDSNENPVFAVYSQHHAGEKAEWQDVETVDDTHPEVYVALGSHANYFRYYQGKLGTESDTVGNAYTLSPEELEMVILGEIGEANHPVSQDWLEFGGRWGDWAELVDAYFGAAGPSGPGHDENMEKWYYPASWGSDKFQVTGSWFTASLVVYYLAYIIAAIIGIIALYKIWKIIKRQREGRLNLMKILHSKAALGIIIGIIGVAVYLVALFLPWYTVTGNINTTLIDTAGTTEIVLIDGLNGLRINMIQGNQGLTTLFGLGIPFGIIFLGNVIMNALDIIGVEKPKDLSRTYIISAFTSLIPLIIIIAFIVALTGVVTSVAGSVTGGQPIPQQVNDIVSAMSSAPFGGGFTDTLDSVGTIDIAWGLAIGSFMFIAASAIKLIAGIMLRVSKAS